MDVYNSKCPSIYRGKVISNDDPMKLGRCKIRVPSVNSDNSTINTLPWARPIVLSPVSKGRGSVSIPDVGDIVWVMFEGANKQFPIYFGGTYSTGDIPVDMTKETIYLEDGNSLTYDRSSKSYELNIGESVLKITSEGITLLGNVSIQGDLIVSGTIVSSEDKEV